MKKDRRWEYTSKDLIFFPLILGTIFLYFINIVFAEETTMWVLFLTLFLIFTNWVWAMFSSRLILNHNLYVIEKEYPIEDETNKPRRTYHNLKKKR